MRISTKEIKVIKESILSIRPDAEVYLFGSRVDDKAKGGDIDILILSEKKIEFDTIADLEWDFWTKCGEKKIDFVSFTNSSDAPFKHVALHKAIRL